MKGLLGDSVVKSLPTNVEETRDSVLILGLGRCAEVGNGTPLQYSYLKNSTDRGAYRPQYMGLQRVGHD